MTAREKKLMALGAGAGVLAAALAIGILMVREQPSFASMPAASAAKPAPAMQPEMGRDKQPGTQPGFANRDFRELLDHRSAALDGGIGAARHRASSRTGRAAQFHR